MSIKVNIFLLFFCYSLFYYSPEIFLKYFYRVTRSNQELALDPQQRGKKITIYCCYNYQENIDWREICQQITQELTDALITPALLAPGDIPIQGSNYSSYRSDLNDDGRPFVIQPNVQERAGLPIMENHFQQVLGAIQVNVGNQPLN